MGLLSADFLRQLEQSNGIPDGLLSGQVKQESGGNPRAVSSAGAMGILQLMPGTAKELGVSNPFDPVENATAGAKYLGQQIKAFGGDVEKGLQAYNWGPGNMRSFIRNGVGAKGQPMPAETQQYAGKVMAKAGIGRDLSAELFGDSSTGQSAPVPQKTVGRDLSAELFGDPIQKNVALKDAPLEALKNTPESAGKLVSSLAHMIMRPDLAAKGIHDVGMGAEQNIAGALQDATSGLPQVVQKGIGIVGSSIKGVNPLSKVSDLIDYFRGVDPKQQVAMADAMGQDYKNAYGSKQAAINTFAHDPLRVLLDASTVLGGGGTLANAAKFGKVGDVLNAASNLTNPVVLGAKGATAVVKGTGRTISTLGKQGLGMSTGVGAESIGQAAKSGFKGDKTFLDNVNGSVPKSDVVNQVQEALQTMGTKRKSAYNSGMATTAADTTPLKFDAIDQALKDGMATTKSQTGKNLVNDADAGKLDELNRVIDDWRNTPAEHTASGLDSLKKRIDNISVDYNNSNAAARIITQVRNAVKQTIVDQSPEYAQTMKGYEEGMRLENEMKKAFSTGNNASIDTQLRKLQSLSRNNASTSYGHRLELAEALKNGTGQDLMPAIAGQAMSEWTPRGLAQRGGALAMGVGGFSNPAAWAALPFQSPRLIASALYGGGRVAGSLNKVLNPFIRQATKISPKQALLLGQAANVEQKVKK